MAYGFSTWDASGTDNNTGLVKINAVGVWVVSAIETGSKAFPQPPGYSLYFLYQPAGDVQSGRRKISVSGSSISVNATSEGDYSDGTIPNSPGAILVYAR